MVCQICGHMMDFETEESPDIFKFSTWFECRNCGHITGFMSNYNVNYGEIND